MSVKKVLIRWISEARKVIFQKKSFVLGDTVQSINDVKNQIPEEYQNGIEIYTDPRSCFYNLNRHSTSYTRGYIVSSEEKKRTAEITCKMARFVCPNTKVTAVYHN